MVILCYISVYVPNKAYKSKKYKECQLFLISEVKIILELNKKYFNYIEDINRIDYYIYIILYLKVYKLFMMYLIYTYINFKTILLNVPTKRMLYH